MSDALLDALDLIKPGDRIWYQGDHPVLHGPYRAFPCDCFDCSQADESGSNDIRYKLTGVTTIRCVMRESVQRI